jgi:hypothetical protein
LLATVYGNHELSAKANVARREIVMETLCHMNAAEYSKKADRLKNSCTRRR